MSYPLEGRTVLVTGGAGNIGSHVVDQLLLEGAGSIRVYDNFSEGYLENLAEALKSGRVEVIRGDIRDPEDVERAMAGADYVFHEASLLLLESRQKPHKSVAVNVAGTLNVLEAAVRHKVKKLIFASSASVFGEPSYLPVDEQHPFNNVTIYGGTKLMGEQLCTSFAHYHGLPFVGLRYYNVYGPRQSIKGAYAQILPRWLDQLEAGGPLTIFGDGSQSMDLIFVRDIARANLLALKRDIVNEFFNIGTGIETTVRELADTLMDLMDKRVKVVLEPHDVNLVKRRRCATEKAERLLGFKANISVAQGLGEFIAWRNRSHSSFAAPQPALTTVDRR